MKRKTRKRAKKLRLTRHHDLARSRGGPTAEWNLYEMSMEHHVAYHTLFRNRTFAEAAEVLRRMEQFHNRPKFKKGECE